LFHERSELYISRSKFNVDSNPTKRTYEDIVYDSEMEMRFYRDWLLPKVASGEIISYQKQVTYILQDKFTYQGKTILPITYVADFVCEFNDGSKNVIDTKGYADSTAQLKKKMFKFRYPDLNYLWITWSACDGGWIKNEDLKKARAKRKKEKHKKKTAEM
jgi:hypothetical protein